MAPEDSVERKGRRKLLKKRPAKRHSSMHFPERFKDGDDAQDDVTATHGKPSQYMNQSVFSMIAAAGSQTNFHARFEDESSDSDENNDASKAISGMERAGVTILPIGPAGDSQKITAAKGPVERRRGTKSEHKGKFALPKLNLRTAGERKYMLKSIPHSSSSPSSPVQGPRHVTPRDAPVLSRMLEAQAQLAETAQTSDQIVIAESPTSAGQSKQPTNLMTRLKEIFRLDRPEEVISG